LQWNLNILVMLHDLRYNSNWNQNRNFCMSIYFSFDVLVIIWYIGYHLMHHSTYFGPFSNHDCWWVSSSPIHCPATIRTIWTMTWIISIAFQIDLAGIRVDSAPPLEVLPNTSVGSTISPKSIKIDWIRWIPQISRLLKHSSWINNNWISN